MRISSKSIYEAATSQLASLQSGLARTQQQISTNRRIQTPSDDPIASARALEVTQSQTMNTQFATNRDSAKTSLSNTEVALSSVTTLIQDVQERLVYAGNGTLNDTDRATVATELEGRLNDLTALANTSDGTGGYLFAGFKTGTMPFTQNAAGAQYNGDQGQRKLQVSSARQMDVSAAGSAVFESGMTGNGKFVAASVNGNGGTGVMSSTSAASLPGGHSYAVTFGAAGTYDVTDTSGNPPVSVTVTAPVSGQKISVGGIAFDIAGSVVAGDKFIVEPSKKESIFTTLTNVIALLRTPVSGTAGKVSLSQGLSTAQNNLGNSYDNVLTVRAAGGSSLKELDSLDSAGADLDIQYTATLSGLQDLDLIKAYSLFTQQKLTLEAAQKTFTTMSGMSLFNYIR